MNNSLDILIDVLEKSVEKNGNIPLTTNHLLNILKMVDRMQKQIEEDDYSELEMYGYFNDNF